MLLNFKIKNYKSFKEETVFSLTPVPKQKDLEYSIIKRKVGNKELKALCSSVFYGPNASGKTNLIGALDVMKRIVLRGDIKNMDNDCYPNFAAGKLELIPNVFLDEPEPVVFSVTFSYLDYYIEYNLSLDLGKFLEVDHKRKILDEELYLNGVLLFKRGGTLEIGNLEAFPDLVLPDWKQYREGAIALAKSSLRDDELFLVNGFKTMFSSMISSLVTDWFKNQLQTLIHSEVIRSGPSFPVDSSKKEKIVFSQKLNDAAKLFGISSNKLVYIQDKGKDKPELYSVFEGKAKNMGIQSEVFESFGTIRFVNLFPVIMNALVKGQTLVIDEFDASIHPSAVMEIINIFHNDEVNINGAQLIFDTHNPIFLNSNFFRRDEIKFVDRDQESHNSTMYSLADFGTSGNCGVRRTDDYMKNYFVDRYGAIRDIDLTSLARKIIAKETDNSAKAED